MLALLLAACAPQEDLLSRPRPDPGADSALDTEGQPDSAPPGESAPADDTGGLCSPPDTVRVGGVCVPSCAYAGGDTCTDSSTTLCEGLTALDSYDCALCCDGPSYPAPKSASFHVIDQDDPYAWDAIWALYSAYGGAMITSQNHPDWLPYADWAQNIHTSWYASGADMAAAIHAALVHEAAAPAYVLIDELNSGTISLIYDAAETMRSRYPQWQGRWGAWQVNGESVAYSGLNPAIDSLLYAGAVIVPEMYARQSSYCAAADSAGSRDVWLAASFDGGSSGFSDRFGWLIQRRSALGSASRVVPAFGVVDSYMDGTNAAIFLDRMFYVWRTRSAYPSSIDLSNGGVGAWKWDEVEGSEYSMSNTSRDYAFSESFVHYSVSGSTSSLKGQVDCE